jgi:pilus assembly protein CpaC
MSLLNVHQKTASNQFGFIRKILIATLFFALNSVNPVFSQEKVVGIPTPTALVAQPKSTEAQNSIALTVGKTLSYRFKAPVARIAIGNANVADVLSTTALDVQFLGKKTGSTNVIIWYKDGGFGTLDLIVVGDANYLTNLLYKLFPSGNVFQISSAGESIILAGIAKDADTVQKAVRITEEASGRKVLNMLSTESLSQVLLEVKIAEIDRTVSSALGISFENSNFFFSLSVI